MLRITAKKTITEVKSDLKKPEETPHVTEFNVWSNAVPEVFNETKPVKKDVKTKPKTDYTTMSIEELREFAGKHNILVKDADSIEYIIGLIEQHVKDHH